MMKTTKRLLSALLAFLLTLALVACSAAPNMKEDGGIGNAGGGNYVQNDGGNGAPNKGNDAGIAQGPSNGSYGNAFNDAVDAPNGELFPLGKPTPDVELPTFAENKFVTTAEERLSTLSADVDTASYAYFRKLVNRGYSWEQLVNSGASFRTEEFLNYFKYELSAPQNGELFGITSEIMRAPWSNDTHLLRLSVQAEKITERLDNNLVFLIDVSGSMRAEDKLELLKQSFFYLTENLTENDTVSIVTYSGTEAVVLDGARGDETDRILQAIRSLVASGSTNGEAGLNMAYAIAEKHFLPEGNNRIIMASDGDLNVGISSSEELTAFVETKRDAGIFLSVLGFGTGNYRDGNMEALADHGNGIYYYIDSMSEAARVLGDNLLGTLYTVAKDVKLQLDFDPTYVSAYRLIGYENRVLNNEDFENDQKDAGEIGAGHSFTVFYELKLTDAVATEVVADWIALSVRYKAPDGELSLLNEYKIGSDHMWINPSEDAIFMQCVIQTAMLLHRSEYAGNVTLSGIIETLETLDLSAHADRAEFLALLKTLA